MKATSPPVLATVSRTQPSKRSQIRCSVPSERYSPPCMGGAVRIQWAQSAEDRGSTSKLSGVLGNVAQAGEIALRELLPVAHARHALSRDLLRREGEEGLAPIGLEGALQGRRCGRRSLVPGGLPAQATRRRQSYAHAPFPRRVPDTRRSRLASGGTPIAAIRPPRPRASGGSPTGAPSRGPPRYPPPAGTRSRPIPRIPTRR